MLRSYNNSKIFSFSFFLCRQGKGTAFEAAGLRIGQTILQVDGIKMEGENLSRHFPPVALPFPISTSRQSRRNFISGKGKKKKEDGMTPFVWTERAIGAGNSSACGFVAGLERLVTPIHHHHNAWLL